MQQILNWFLSFCSQFFTWIFTVESADGFSLGGMVVGITIVGLIIAATVGTVAVVTSVIRVQGTRRDNDG